ncbi:MAG: hypothetical protein MMC33_003308 [Icmadophila ericetorum]|nr:hypothetical protein [Icmadophila ericetorum]
MLPNECIRGIFEILSQFISAVTFEIYNRVAAIETAIDNLNNELSLLVPRITALEIEVDVQTRDFSQQRTNIERETDILFEEIAHIQDLYAFGTISRPELEEFVRGKMVELNSIRERKERLMEGVAALDAKSKLVINEYKDVSKRVRVENAKLAELRSFLLVVNELRHGPIDS